MAGVLTLLGSLLLIATPGQSADHLEAPLVMEDGRTDIADLYAFQSPTNPDNTVLIMTVNPGAGLLSPTTFDPDAEYRFNLDTNGDSSLDRVIRVNFDDTASGQTVTVTGAGGNGSGVVGEPFALSNGGQVTTGVFDDPFFFDLQAFLDQIKGAGGSRTFCDGNETDFFAGLDVSAIVVEVPSASITDGSTNVGVWAETHNGAIVDQMGRPAIATVLIDDGSEDAYNATPPNQQNNKFGDQVEAALLFFSGLDGSGYTPDEAAGITDLLLPDILTVDVGTTLSFVPDLNGRTLADDVIDLELVVVTGGLGANGSPVLTGDCVDGNNKPFLNSFPFLASANAGPVGPGDFTTTTGSDDGDANIGDGVCDTGNGKCSLRAAIQEGNAAGGATINLRGDVHWVRGSGGEDAAASGDLDISGDITIVGRTGASVYGTGSDRLFDVQAGASLTISATKLSSGNAPSTESGGAIRNLGTVDLTGVVLADNAANTGAGASGGAILNAGTLTGSNVRILRNAALRAGGGIEATAGSSTVLTGAWIARNSAGPMPGNGGGIHTTGDGYVEISNSKVVYNDAASEGGGLWNSATGTMVSTNTTFDGNSAHGDDADQGGGALFNDGGTLTITDGLILNSKADGASGSGGGVFNNGGTLTVTGTRITANMANRAGGGIEAKGGTTTVDNVRFLQNRTGTAPGNGGALHISGVGTVDVSNSKVTANMATEGGGFWNSAGGVMTITNTDFNWNAAAGNDADQGGGALYNAGGTMSVNGGRILANRASGTSGSGGAILNNSGTLTVTDTFISSNTSKRAGGGIEAVEGQTTLTGVTLAANITGSAPGNGGGLHLTGAGTVDVNSSIVRYNRAAKEGGGLWNSSTGTMNVSADTQVFKNKAPVGLDLFNDGGTLNNQSGA